LIATPIARKLACFRVLHLEMSDGSWKKYVFNQVF